MNKFKVYFSGKNINGEVVDCCTQEIIAKDQNEAIEKFKKSSICKPEYFWIFSKKIN
ncbi:hypothetical protein [Xenorhabdus cabanillasii]|uniref:Uncharacterized protein n=1 Tax=Xenorhabdus cabanillasii JM26 TaxID=1427517 RepID=W1J9C5_9GAMM|nr:hypothetical protein [Xenorhabdus cabanillasii]PHM75504.1 hypothetical protein Xcab_04012 [Xenorhabdus cabanillasii JM26]CDL86446.1 hypothetical protein XCR1_360002 [Xenorhabdus cabanillasii JM26]